MLRNITERVRNLYESTSEMCRITGLLEGGIGDTDQGRASARWPFHMRLWHKVALLQMYNLCLLLRADRHMQIL